ncbi:hypothetical protein GCM10010112_92620 [Actinoplanes lobatus]|uniref:Uncharacterized protein n=1 Tax=Actinoplanes lobatus TaxID=113568 RepID=A0A7W7HL08_9ACTN|nr:hypothetical protein [Actinoplanes lobatus]GGN99118.1 hypothetical protein GCM10010112_92620 [Actinoplanes lobatus]GIE46291.1 hypothetical protein Alo02nite_91890 [Actinoplanes lobatus]
MTGRAAACCSRSSSVSRCRCGSTDRDIRNASGQPGRIGSGVTVRASSSEASTDLVVGRSTAAVTVLVATSIRPVSSTRPTTPSSSMTAMSNGVESICISSPVRTGEKTPNGPSGLAASARRVRADPVTCRPAVTRSNSR